MIEAFLEWMIGPHWIVISVLFPLLGISTYGAIVTIIGWWRILDEKIR